MPTATYAGQTVEVDDQGFMLNASEWTREIAAAIASDVGIELTDEHWKVIEFCRSDAADTGDAPGLRRISKQCDGVTMKDLYRLFPRGPGKLAARVSGLKKPTGCV